MIPHIVFHLIILPSFVLAYPYNVSLRKVVFVFRGSLLTRSITDLVKKEDFVQDSDYLTTLLVVVPRYRQYPPGVVNLHYPAFAPICVRVNHNFVHFESEWHRLMVQGPGQFLPTRPCGLRMKVHISVTQSMIASLSVLDAWYFK